MCLPAVRQLQTMNALMKHQLAAYPAVTAMIFGIAGGNGLEYVDRRKYKKVYAIDINADYLAATARRYAMLDGCLECRRLDLCSEADQLPRAELVIANLVIEYIGYAAFQRAVVCSEARYVSCVIQRNADARAWVSDSPYLHAFDGLEAVHCQMEENALTQAMDTIGYAPVNTDERPLPNGKKLILLDYARKDI